MKVRVSGEAVLVAAAVLAVAGLLWYAKKKAEDLLPYVNPADSNNIVNQGVTSAYQWATGSTGTIGGDIYDATHDGTWNPASSNNFINKDAQSLYQWATGSKGTIGSDLYDLIH